MKISLGVDFNKIRTIVSYFDQRNSIIKTLYNQPSCAMIMPKGLGEAFFGDSCLLKDSIPFAYTFYPSVFSMNPELLKPYFKYVFSSAFSSFGNELIEVEYIVFTSSSFDYKIKDSIFAYLQKEFREFKKSKIIFSSSKDLLKLSIIRSLNQVAKIEDETILVLGLNDDMYQASLFNYHLGNNTSIKSYPLFNTYTNIDGFSIGSLRLISDMLDNSISNQNTKIRAILLEKGMTFNKYKLINNLENSILSNNLNLSSKNTFEIKDKKEINHLVLRKEDYDYSLEKNIYGKVDSLRRYLKLIKNEIKDIPYKVIYYGKITFYKDVLGLIQSVFESSNIVPYNKVFNEKVDSITDYDYISKGASLQSSMRFKGYLPEVSYKDYKNRNIAILNRDDDLVLSESLNGISFYSLNKELEIPLSKEVLVNESYIIYINNKEYNIFDYLYDRGRLKSNKSFDKKDNTFIARLRLGIKNDMNKKILLFELSNSINNYQYEFELEVE